MNIQNIQEEKIQAFKKALVDGKLSLVMTSLSKNGLNRTFLVLSAKRILLILIEDM